MIKNFLNSRKIFLFLLCLLFDFIFYSTASYPVDPTSFQILSEPALLQMRLRGQKPNCLTNQLPALRIRRVDGWNIEAAKQVVKQGPKSGFTLNIISRESWGARIPTQKMDPMSPVDGMVIHHSVEGISPKDLQDIHMDREKYADMGYHYIIGRDEQGNWQVYEGRKISFQGAHAGGKDGKNLNIGKIGVVILGDYEPLKANNPLGYDPAKTSESQRIPEKGAVEKLGELTQSLYLQHAGLRTIQPHAMGNHAIHPGHKDCPGKGLVPIVEALQERWKPALDKRIQLLKGSEKK